MATPDFLTGIGGNAGCINLSGYSTGVLIWFFPRPLGWSVKFCGSCPKPCLGLPGWCVLQFLGLVFLRLIVLWAHHMFHSGTPPWMRLVFSVATGLHRVPTTSKFFNGRHTLGRQNPMTGMFVQLCLLVHSFSWITARVAWPRIPSDIHCHDTTFVCRAFSLHRLWRDLFRQCLDRFHPWFPSSRGRIAGNEHLGRLHLRSPFIGFQLCFAHQHFGLASMMARRVAVDPQFTMLNQVPAVWEPCDWAFQHHIHSNSMWLECFAGRLVV